MKRFLLIVTAATAVLAICGMAKANNHNDRYVDDRPITPDPVCLRQNNPPPLDLDWNDIRRLGHWRFDFDHGAFRAYDPWRFDPWRADFGQEEFRRFDDWEFNNYCF